MRLTKTAMASLAVVAAVAVVGTGFAAYTAGAYVNASGQAGTVGLQWGLTGAVPPVLCTESLYSHFALRDSLNLSVNGANSGQLCVFGATLHNTGNLPAVATETITSTNGAALCGYVTILDLAFTHVPPITVNNVGAVGPSTYGLNAHQTIVWVGSIGLENNIPNALQGTTCDFTVTVTGTAV
jgi:hypothetical protein